MVWGGVGVHSNLPTLLMLCNEGGGVILGWGWSENGEITCFSCSCSAIFQSCLRFFFDTCMDEIIHEARLTG